MLKQSYDSFWSMDADHIVSIIMVYHTPMKD